MKRIGTMEDESDSAGAMWDRLVGYLNKEIEESGISPQALLTIPDPKAFLEMLRPYLIDPSKWSDIPASFRSLAYEFYEHDHGISRIAIGFAQSVGHFMVADKGIPVLIWTEQYRGDTTLAKQRLFAQIEVDRTRKAARKRQVKKP